MFGLTLAANRELFGLRALRAGANASAGAEISLHLEEPPDWGRQPLDDAAIRYRTPASEWQTDDNLIVFELAEGFVFRYADATVFFISRDGRELWATWSPATTRADTETYLLGPVLGFAQRLMGVLCLHASAVVVNGAAIALCGPGSAGKSTTAGAFAAAGHSVLADDMTVIHEVGGRAMAMPGTDHLRVWEDSEQILLGSSGALPRLTPTWDKRALNMRGQGWTLCDTPAPLVAIVLLAPRESSDTAPRLTPAPVGDAFVALAANSYANYLLDESMRAIEFASIATLLQRVQVFRGTPHADPARLGEFVQLIVDVRQR